MSLCDTTLAWNEYRLVLVKSGSNAIWTERKGSDLHLPRITVPRLARQAEEVQKGIEAIWRARNIVLDFLPRGQSSRPFVVSEILGPNLPHGLTACSVEAGYQTSDHRRSYRELSIQLHVWRTDTGHGRKPSAH